jgi:hypothetical protein
MIAADSQQRSREQGELMPGDCGGRLKREKRMMISAPSARGKGNCVPLICRLNAIRLAFALDLESTHLSMKLLDGVHILSATM